MKREIVESQATLLYSGGIPHGFEELHDAQVVSLRPLFPQKTLISRSKANRFRCARLILEESFHDLHRPLLLSIPIKMLSQTYSLLVRPLGDVSGGTDVFREHCWRGSGHQRYAFGRLFRRLRDTAGKNAIARVNFHKDLDVWPNPGHISTLQARGGERRQWKP